MAKNAKAQVLNYPTIRFLTDSVKAVDKKNNQFHVQTKNNTSITAKKILFATGVKDELPNIKGFAACWGISVLHCPYCHGYEVANKKLGVLANGETAFELCKLIQHWSKDLTLFTNGNSNLTEAQIKFLAKLNINIVDAEIAE